MRMMLRITIPVESGNTAIRDGSLPATLKSTMEKLKPEAAYFVAQDGERSAMFFFDMDDSSEIPPIVEPLFQNLNASVQLAPAMNIDDLQAGLGKLHHALPHLAHTEDLR